MGKKGFGRWGRDGRDLRRMREAIQQGKEMSNRQINPWFLNER